MTDHRALIFETETPSEKPRFHPPRHPRWEKKIGRASCRERV